MTCANQVMVAVVGIAGVPIYRPCGTWYGGTQYFCSPCTAKLEKQYPQGWAYTPGDLCKHGVYVGGCMEDFMCIACENGE